jgi:hypothetical protein
MLNKIKDLALEAKWKYQRATRGWSDDELFNLDHEIAKFILPRLKAYRANITGWPSGIHAETGGDDVLSRQAWERQLDTMIAAFEVGADPFALADGEDVKKVNKGLASFAKYYQSLWQ